MAKVYFIGAGPGDPELITLKAVKIIERADVIIYAGSLVSQEILSYTKETAEIYNSAILNLEEIMGIMERAVAEDKTVARIHSGDPGLYGAIGEQVEWLEQKGISFEVVPGVSSFLAAAASLKKEYTLPEVSQTVILTRLKGRTSVPEKEKLSSLAKHQASMCIFLSVHMIEEVVEELKKGYPPQTPVAVVEKASWPEERTVKGTLENIAQLVNNQKINKTALVMVGDFLCAKDKRSRLYDKAFSHGFRGKV